MKVHYVYGLFLLLAFAFSSCKESSNYIFVKQTCDYRNNPLGIDNKKPLFSWIVEGKGNNLSQSGYQIIVASTPDRLNLNDADIWNTGKVYSKQSIHVQFAGATLQSSTRYWWKVKIWDQDGVSSDWSAVNLFEMALLDSADWNNAQWMALKEDGRVSDYRFREIQSERMSEPKIGTSFPVGYFRKQVKTNKAIDHARVYVCGLGYHEFYLNGQKIGNHVLDPAPTNYDDHSLYVVHELPTHILEVENTFGVILGNGFYGQNLAFPGSSLSYGQPVVKILIKLFYKDGTVWNVPSDQSWKASTGPIVFDNVYAGETYDARFELGDWDKNAFDDSMWADVKIQNPSIGQLRSQVMPPIRKIKALSPQGMFQTEKGTWIIDFGQNISGWVAIKVKEEKGREVKLVLAEALSRKGDAIHTGSTGKFATGFDQVSGYICKGTGWEQWEPRFTYHGFQYAEISGLSNKPEIDDFKAMVVHTDVEKTGSFKCTDSLLNKLYNVSEWTVLDNLHGIPEDCPHREKCGWLGDAHAVAAFSLYNYDMALFYQKYINDMLSQRRQTKGKGKDEKFKIPTMVAPGKRAPGIASLDWGIAMIYLPWYSYLYYGDESFIKDNYLAMIEMVKYYLTFKNQAGIIQNGLGDWCPPRWDRNDNPDAMECHPFISASAYFYDILKITRQMAELMNDDEAQTWLQKEAEQLKASFNAEFLVDVEGTPFQWYGSQTATVMALQFGMVFTDKKQDVVNGLKYDIEKTHSGHHSTGIHGNRYIYSLLNDLGEEDLSYSILTHPEFPSQGYIVNAGLNTWPERQWEWGSGIEWDRSLNHPMQAGFAAWFYESLGGIRPVKDMAGFKEFMIKPSFLKQLGSVESSILTPYGQISVNWKHTSDFILLNVAIPFNTKARLALPYNDFLYLYVNDKEHSKVKGTASTNDDNKSDKLMLGSGKYQILLSNKKQM